MIIFHYVFNMTVIASVVFLLFLGFEQITKHFFKASWHYNVLKFILLFFILPVGSLGNVLLQRLPANNESFIDFHNYFMTDYIESCSDSTLVHSYIFKSILIIWFVGMGIIIVRNIICYLRFRFISVNNRRAAENRLYWVADECAKEQGIKRQIKLYVNEYINTPMLTGIINPIILLPGNDMKLSNAKYIISHELTHYRNKDVLIKLVTLILKTIYWYNPVIYLLSSKMDKWCEYACDEMNTANLSHENKKRYGLAILECAVDMPVYSTNFGASFLLPKHDLKKRLMFLFNVRKTRKKALFISAVMSIIFINTAIMFSFATEYVVSGNKTKYHINSKEEINTTFLQMNQNDFEK